jgi:hypothetical protein
MSVNDIKAKLISIMLDKERHLKFDLNAFAELEEIYGDFQVAMNAMQNRSIKAIRAMLWAGLIHEDEKLTIKQVGSMIDMTNINKIVSAISKAISEAMPKVDEEKNA